MIILSQNQIRLCCNGRGGCPVLERDITTPDMFTLTDDYAGKVLLKKEELSMLKEAIEHFEKE